MGLKDKFFGKREAREPKELPPILQPENPVNYDSVLDWLLGLDDKDYKRMLDVVTIYREANKAAAKVLKVKDKPTTELLPPPPTDEEVDEQLDNLLDSDDLMTDFLEDDLPEKTPKKSQAPSKETKISIKDTE